MKRFFTSFLSNRKFANQTFEITVLKKLSHLERFSLQFTKKSYLTNASKTKFRKKNYFAFVL